MAYTYDQTRITEWGVDRMRLDLGDVEVSGGETTCALSDEEYGALIGETYGAGGSWKLAQYRCLQAIVARMAMAANVKLDGLEIDMSDRFERWKIMLRCKEELFCGLSAPASPGAPHRAAITRGLHDNPRAGQRVS